MSWAQKVSKSILNIMGWRVTGSIPTTKKGIFVVAPHTHWMDIPIGLLVRSAIDLEVKFIAKKSLFRGLKGPIFKYLGGYPVDRSKSQGYVESVADIFNQHDQFFIAIAPEGTRQKVHRFKTGFYYIARKANVPIYLTKFDFENKEVNFNTPIWPEGEPQKQIAEMEDYFKGVKGKVVAKSF
ncbi:1-acyl-sn-glycerol-3-phosphate acyltransferase [Membranihabitans maritimus]|uniref:1-acyl-sn-glycerol-3-phosphate acyltransferase n=1 Tax=Membranihabitans maritimus TaxID=2904244 RepID=UPI001F00EC1D|nr:1-acyl-sn-glycerol-3-phosphate acyltransferase [Membranihabitans maritimus]